MKIERILEKCLFEQKQHYTENAILQMGPEKMLAMDSTFRMHSNKHPYPLQSPGLEP